MQSKKTKQRKEHKMKKMQDIEIKEPIDSMLIKQLSEAEVTDLF